jgi:DNA-binding MarR family transcriptional regulator
VLRGLQGEIKQNKPFPSLEDEAYLNLLRTTDALVRKEVEALKAWGLSPTQYNTLRILRGAGEAGVTCREMSERLLTKDPDITRLVDRLETRGLIQRGRSDQDRRVVRMRITKAGLKLLAELDAPAMQWTREQLGHMSKEQLRGLIQLLELARAKVML